MSLSKECANCPFDKGFEPQPGDVLTVCGDPSQRCINLRGKLIDQLAEWNRMARIAEVARVGKLPLELLCPGDQLAIMASQPGRSLNADFDREIRLTIDSVDEDGLTGTVIADSYHEDNGSYAFDLGETSVVIAGACERSPSGNREHDRLVSGEIHVGRYLEYTRSDQPDLTFVDLYVQEVALLSADKTTLGMLLFGTDWSAHRAALPL